MLLSYSLLTINCAAMLHYGIRVVPCTRSRTQALYCVYSHSVCSCRVPTSGSVHHRLRTGIINRNCNARQLPAYYQTVSAYGLRAVLTQLLCAHKGSSRLPIPLNGTHIINTFIGSQDVAQNAEAIVLIVCISISVLVCRLLPAVPIGKNTLQGSHYYEESVFVSRWSFFTPCVRAYFSLRQMQFP